MAGNLPGEAEAVWAVVPALNEAAGIGALVAALRAQGAVVLVVDGGSSDGTAAVAAAAGARVLQAPRGRGAQLRAGAEVAEGGVIWFVHADSAIPAGAVEALRRAARAADWGCFTVAVEGGGRRLRFAAAWMNARARAWGSATGDMGLWARRDLLERLGGFPPLPLCEDLAFCAAARPAGAMAVLPLVLGTSGRRWHENGVNRTILRMWLVRALYHAGADPAALARLYGAGRSAKTEPPQPS